MADETKAKQGGTKPQIAIYQRIASREDEIITKLFELMDSRNENIALGATKTLLNKIVPDLKSTEITGQNGEPIKLNIIAGADYLSQLGVSTSAPAGSSLYEPTAVQSASVAPQSPQDNNSNNAISEGESA